MYFMIATFVTRVYPRFLSFFHYFVLDVTLNAPLPPLFHFHFHSACPNQPVRVEKQLSERVNAEPGIRVSFLMGLLGVDLDSKLRLRSCLMAEIKCTVGSGGGSGDLNFLQKFICLVMASSVLTSLSVLTISSFMASAHSPHIHLP